MPNRPLHMVENLIHEVSFPILTATSIVSGVSGSTIATFKPKQLCIVDWGFTKESVTHNVLDRGLTYKYKWGYRFYANVLYKRCDLQEYMKFFEIWNEDDKVNRDRLIKFQVHGGNETELGTVYPPDIDIFNVSISSASIPTEYFGNRIKYHNLRFSLIGSELIEEDPRKALLRNLIATELPGGIAD